MFGRFGNHFVLVYSVNIILIPFRDVGRGGAMGAIVLPFKSEENIIVILPTV